MSCADREAQKNNIVTIQKVVFREVFWHIFAKIPRHTRQNAITEGDLECILTRDCEGTEQLRNIYGEISKWS